MYQNDKNLTIYMCVYVCMYVCMYASLYEHLFVMFGWMQRYMNIFAKNACVFCACVCKYMSLHIPCIYLSIYACMYVCLCLFDLVVLWVFSMWATRVVHVCIEKPSYGGSKTS